jgi:hypothetical protein
VAEFGHNNPESFFQPFRYQAPMAAHVERLPTQNDGIGAEVLSDLLWDERFKLLAVFPVKQVRVFRFQKPRGAEPEAGSAFPGRIWVLPG